MIDANYANFGHIPYGQSLVSIFFNQALELSAWTKNYITFQKFQVIVQQCLTSIPPIVNTIQIGTIYHDVDNPDMCVKSDPVALKALE